MFYRDRDLFRVNATVVIISILIIAAHVVFFCLHCGGQEVDTRTDEQRRADLDQLLVRVARETREVREKAEAVTIGPKADSGCYGDGDWIVWAEPKTWRAKRMHEASLAYAKEFCKSKGMPQFDPKSLGSTFLHVHVDENFEDKKTVWPCGRGWGMPGSNRIWVYAQTEEMAYHFLQQGVEELITWKLIKGPQTHRVGF